MESNLINECSQIDESSTSKPSNSKLIPDLELSQIVESRCHFLQTLPNSLLVDLLSNWMTVWDIIFLDSALCNHLLRAQFLQLLTEQGLIVNPLVSIPSLTGYRMIQWIENRKIRLCSIRGDLSLTLSYSQSMDVLRLNCITDLHIDVNGFELSNGAMIFHSLPSLIHLTLSNVVGDSSIIRTLRNCPNLQVLKIQNTSVFPLSDLFDLPSYCPKLKSLSFLHLNFDAVHNFISQLSEIEEIIVETCHNDINTPLRQQMLLKKLSESPPQKLSPIKRIHCKFAWHSSGVYFYPIFNLCPELENLYLSGYYLNEVDIAHLIASCSLLKHLQLIDCLTFTDDMLRSVICNYSGRLTTVNLSYCSFVSDRSFPLLADTLSESLQSFTVASYYSTKLLNDDFLNFFKRCHKLKSLCLTSISFTEEFWSNAIDDESFIPSLTSLILRHCNETKNKDFVMFLKKCGKTLRKLEISEALCLNDDVLSAIAENCTQLQDLNLSGCIDLSEEALKSFIAERMTMLRVLQFARLKVTSDVVRAIGRRLKMLEVLDITNFQGKYDFEALQDLSTGCPALHTLIIKGIDCGPLSKKLIEWFPPYRVNVVK